MNDEEVVMEMCKQAWPDKVFHEEFLILDEVNLENLIEEPQILEEVA